MGGGVPAIVQWLVKGINASRDFDVSVFDLAVGSRDPDSTLIRKPATWLRKSLEGPKCDGVVHSGC